MNKKILILSILSIFAIVALTNISSAQYFWDYGYPSTYTSYTERDHNSYYRETTRSGYGGTTITRQSKDYYPSYGYGYYPYNNKVYSYMKSGPRYGGYYHQTGPYYADSYYRTRYNTAYSPYYYKPSYNSNLGYYSHRY